MENLFKIFLDTIDDNIFSRNEYRAVKQTLKEDYLLDDRDRSKLVSKIFDIAKGKLGNNPTDNQKILAWFERANKVVNDFQDSQVYFSPGMADKNCKNIIIDNFIQVKKKIDICINEITDIEIGQEIVNCFERDIEIRIFIEDSNVNNEYSLFYQLRDAGLDIRIDDHCQLMKNKFVIFDDNKLITGSYNWTIGSSENIENILVTTNQYIVEEYIAEFNKLWGQFIPDPDDRIRLNGV